MRASCVTSGCTKPGTVEKFSKREGRAVGSRAQNAGSRYFHCSGVVVYGSREGLPAVVPNDRWSRSPRWVMAVDIAPAF